MPAVISARGRGRHMRPPPPQRQLAPRFAPARERFPKHADKFAYRFGDDEYVSHKWHNDTFIFTPGPQYGIPRHTIERIVIDPDIAPLLMIKGVSLGVQPALPMDWYHNPRPATELAQTELWAAPLEVGMDVAIHTTWQDEPVIFPRGTVYATKKIKTSKWVPPEQIQAQYTDPNRLTFGITTGGAYELPGQTATITRSMPEDCTPLEMIVERQPLGPHVHVDHPLVEHMPDELQDMAAVQRMETGVRIERGDDDPHALLARHRHRLLRSSDVAAAAVTFAGIIDQAAASIRARAASPSMHPGSRILSGADPRYGESL